jgi:heat-inducible transcriptional repressor
MTREEQILKLIVEYFVKTAQPVGSQTLLEEYHLPYSSATIRAEMNSLEKEGYLEKTHTSSGRVPSSKGYTYYVEHLREESVDNSVKFALQKVLDQRSQSVEEILKESCEILSHMTNLASVVLGPKADEEHLLSVQIIPLSQKTATAVFVTDKGYVENKTFIVEDGQDVNQVKKTVELLNERLKGTPISGLVPKMEAMRPAMSDYLVGHDVVYQAILQAFVKFAGERMELYGKENLYDVPEFAEDAKKLRAVLELADDPNKMRKALEAVQSSGGDDVGVMVGKEGSGLEDVTILSAKVNLPGQKGTSISLVGPSRMDYDKAVAMLNYVSKALDAYFNDGHALGEPRGEKKGENGCPQQKKKESGTKVKPQSKPEKASPDQREKSK